jgi:hypothetical protein
MRRIRLLRVLKVALFATLAAAAISFFVMILWNSLMPDVFAVHTISFWQALGLLLLSKLLFGGIRPGFAAGSPWRRRMMERWERMTPEERESFRQGTSRRCAGRPNVEASNAKAEAQA